MYYRGTYSTLSSDNAGEYQISITRTLWDPSVQTELLISVLTENREQQLNKSENSDCFPPAAPFSRFVQIELNKLFAGPLKLWKAGFVQGTL